MIVNVTEPREEEDETVTVQEPILAEEEPATTVTESGGGGGGTGGTNVSTGSVGGVASTGEALVGFHEDALSQAAVGKAQRTLGFILGFAMAADCSELTTLGYIMPAAELHLCADDHRKGWLVSITLLALAIGSLSWGILGDRLGRRRALVSALSVAALFSAVATFMPTYGTFMTARFCSGLGIAGVIPLSFSYLAETCPMRTRPRFVGFLHAFWPLGALVTSTLAQLTLPMNGAETVLDNQEHWSSWHKFLILNILPTIICLVGLFSTSESPRYLLEASREVEALEVYQRFHKMNRVRTKYGLTELELPGRNAYREQPASPTTNVFNHGVATFREAFQKITSPTHFRTTLLLAALNLLVGFIYSGISTFSPAMIKELNDQQYDSSKIHIFDVNYTDLNFNATIDNVVYRDCLFRNATFTHLNLNHVEFFNCDFDEVEFSNVKSSITVFRNSTIRNCRFVDTDLNVHDFVHCQLINNTFLSLLPDCTVDFDYNIYLEDLFKETDAWSGAMFPVLVILGYILEAISRPPVAVVLFVAASLVAIGIFFLYSFASILIVEATIKLLLICAINVLTLVVIEAYPCHLRCTAHGLMRCLYHLGALCAVPIYGLLVHSMLMFPAVITITVTFFAALLSTRIQDNSKVLL